MWLFWTQFESLAHPSQRESPRAYLIDNFLSSDECDFLVRLGRPLLQKALIVDRTTQEAKNRVNTELQENFHRGILQGGRNLV
jgi:hypothetical protein